MIVAIDGTVCSGKSTIAKRLAEYLGFFHLNTGSIYRALTIKMLNEGVSNNDVDAIARCLKTTKVELKHIAGEVIILLDGVDVSREIRTPRISSTVALYSKVPIVREYVRQVQVETATKADTVIEGRDIGTVVFPNAEVKIFMTADDNVRAKRRYMDYLKQGKEMSFDEVKREVLERDRLDMERAISPLKPADDAIIYQNNGDNIDVVIADLAKIVEDARENNR